MWVDGQDVQQLEARSVPFVCSIHRVVFLCAVLAAWGESVAEKIQRDE